jgi:hypothetical protein
LINNALKRRLPFPTRENDDTADGCVVVHFDDAIGKVRVEGHQNGLLPLNDETLEDGTFAAVEGHYDVFPMHRFYVWVDKDVIIVEVVGFHRATLEA